MIICDRGYLKHQRLWRDRVARKASCRVAQVKSDVVVPLETVSPKAEYAARTIRPKIQKHLDDYLIEIKPVKVQHPNVNHSFDGLEWKRPADILSLLNIDGTVPDVTRFFKGGTSRAKKIFGNFIRARLKNYEKNHNQPQTDDPYWNGAMQAMKYTGFMHNYMRMYWGKKILEWSSSPERAFRNTLAMNNKYFLDGWEPNSYAGVGMNFRYALSCLAPTVHLK